MRKTIKMIKPIHMNEAFRMFKRKLNYDKFGFKTYTGNSVEICEQIVKDCYNKKKHFFMTSTGHFCEYYSRDFGIYVQSLKELGYKKEIDNTINYSLNLFRKNNAITTTISPNDKPFDFPTYAPDSLAYNLHSLATSGNKIIIKEFKSFIEKEAKRFFHIVVDPDTGLVKKMHFSSMKDHSIRKSSCYDNVMVAWVSKNLDLLGLKNPMKDYNHKKIIKDNFWNGESFIEDLSGNDNISGDANVLPFWTNIFSSKKLLTKSINSLIDKGLDKPFPLKYDNKKTKTIWYMSNSDYESNSIWVHLGYPYIEIVSKVNKELAREYLIIYSELIEKYGTFLEVYDKNGKPYKTPFYISDEGMIWASMHAILYKKLI